MVLVLTIYSLFLHSVLIELLCTGRINHPLGKEKTSTDSVKECHQPMAAGYLLLAELKAVTS